MLSGQGGPSGGAPAARAGVPPDARPAQGHNSETRSVYFHSANEVGRAPRSRRFLSLKFSLNFISSAGPQECGPQLLKFGGRFDKGWAFASPFCQNFLKISFRRSGIQRFDAL